VRGRDGAEIDRHEAGAAALFSATDYLRALRRRPVVLAQVLDALADVDVLVTPAARSRSGSWSEASSAITIV
jgi:aspartyl-tRNA(Asn)/glutamyl-tRNA(Gln) amidotransferase subunit A